MGRWVTVQLPSSRADPDVVATGTVDREGMLLPCRFRACSQPARRVDGATHSLQLQITNHES